MNLLCEEMCGLSRYVIDVLPVQKFCSFASLDFDTCSLCFTWAAIIISQLFLLIYYLESQMNSTQVTVLSGFASRKTISYAHVFFSSEADPHHNRLQSSNRTVSPVEHYATCNGNDLFSFRVSSIDRLRAVGCNKTIRGVRYKVCWRYITN